MGGGGSISMIANIIFGRKDCKIELCNGRYGDIESQPCVS